MSDISAKGGKGDRPPCQVARARAGIAEQAVSDIPAKGGKGDRPPCQVARARAGIAEQLP